MAEISDYYPHRDWRPIATYDGSSLVLLRSPTRGLFGAKEGSQWCEMLDGEMYPIPEFEPTEWAPVSDDEIESFAV